MNEEKIDLDKDLILVNLIEHYIDESSQSNLLILNKLPDFNKKNIKSLILSKKFNELIKTNILYKIGIQSLDYNEDYLVKNNSQLIFNLKDGVKIYYFQLQLYQIE